MELQTSIEAVMSTCDNTRRFVEAVLALPRDQRVEWLKKKAEGARSQMSSTNDYDRYALGSQMELWNGIRYLYEAAGVCGDDELADIDIDKKKPEYKDYGWAVYHMTRLNHGLFGNVETMIFRGMDASNFATPEDTKESVEKYTGLGFNHDSAKYVGYTGYKTIPIEKGAIHFNEKAEYGWNVLSSFCLQRIREGRKVVVGISGFRGDGKITSVSVYYT